MQQGDGASPAGRWEGVSVGTGAVRAGRGGGESEYSRRVGCSRE